MPQFLITGTVATNPTQFCPSATPKNGRTLIMIARKGLDGSDGTKANVGPVYIGHSNTDANQPMIFNAGDERVFQSAAGQSMDLSKWYLKVTNDGDGLVVIYE